MKNSTSSNPPKLISNNAKNINKSDIKGSSNDGISSIGNKTRDSFTTDPSDTESVRNTPSPDVSSNNKFSTSSEEKDFECHLCSKKFSQYFHFRKHLLSHL
ncbi:hypothetical protein X975_09681, partial [Stegodyphus mimosarum]